QIERSAQGLLKTTNLRSDAQISQLEALHVGNVGFIARGTLTIMGTGQTREEPQILWLGAAYNEILPDSLVALEKPSRSVDTATLLPFDSTLVIAKVNDVSERSRNEYGMQAKSTRLRLDQNWINPRGQDSMETIRGTSVFAASERLELAEEPIETPIAGN